MQLATIQIYLNLYYIQIHLIITYKKVRTTYLLSLKLTRWLVEIESIEHLLYYLPSLFINSINVNIFNIFTIYFIKFHSYNKL